MADKASEEFEAIRKAAAALESDLQSTDAAVAKKAEAKLKKAGSDLTAWAKKNKITLVSHAEVRPGGVEPMKKCAPVISTVINGKVNVCVLVGTEGRKCLYSCSPATMVPS